MPDPTTYLACPLCGAPLLRKAGSLYCGGARRHCYDVAGSGYVNLLPPGKKNNAKAGDDREMLRSRSRFLADGWYDPISETAARLGALTAGVGGEIVFADAGCGEGYHTCRIARLLGAEACAGIGIDAAKSGAAAGAKLARAMGLAPCLQFVAGNIFAMPLADRSVDLVYSIFAPIAGEEARRILKKGGALIIASAGKAHLWEMRCLLYGTPRVGGGVQMPPGFSTVKKETLSYEMHLPDQRTVASLFAMTPFFYRCPREGRERLLAQEQLAVRVEVDFTVLVRSHG